MPRSFVDWRHSSGLLGYSVGHEQPGIIGREIVDFSHLRKKIHEDINNIYKKISRFNVPSVQRITLEIFRNYQYPADINKVCQLVKNWSGLLQ